MQPATSDTKDWTWVLERPCPECGFDAARVDRADLGDQVRRSARLWPPLLAGSDALDPIERPAPGTWSVLEYACHVRDVHRIFERRLALMLDEDDPGFANWDQDATAVAETYGEQVPGVVAAELVAAADAVAEGYDAVPDDAWERTGRRSNGSIFTTLGLDRYHLHDLVHHAWDVCAVAAAATRASYDGAATAYGKASATLTGPVLQRLDRFAELVGPGGRVL